MPTPTKGPRLGGGPAHQRLILSNLATALFEHDRITTTETKAKRLRPYAERLITFAKRGDLHARRRVMTVIRDKSVVHKLFTEIAPDVEQRPGGYTRITKIAPRKGDNAPMAVIELVREPFSPRQATVKEAEAATKRSAAPAATAAPAAEAPADEPETGATEAEAPAGGDEQAPVETTEEGATQADAPAGGDEQPPAPAEDADSEGTSQAEAPASDNTESDSADTEVAGGATEAEAPASKGEDKA